MSSSRRPTFYRRRPTADVVLWFVLLTLTAVQIYSVQQDFWPFAAVSLLSALGFVSMHWAGLTHDRLATLRDLSTGLTAASTFFAAYSAEIDKIDQGGSTVIMTIPVAVVALRSSTRLRRLERWYAEVDERERERVDTARHEQLLAALRRRPDVSQQP